MANQVTTTQPNNERGTLLTVCPPNQPSYAIRVQTGVSAEIGRLVKEFQPSAVALITDSTVGRLWGKAVRDDLLAANLPTTLIEIPAGEAHKNLSTVSDVYDQLLAAAIDRNGAIVALGGGVVGDLAGFVAATWMRGVRTLVQVPTTILSMVDASVGGKTGVDHPQGKNLIGAFRQPDLVLVDPTFLETLPLREQRSGMAEVIKHAILADPALFEEIEHGLGDKEGYIEHGLRENEGYIEHGLRENEGEIEHGLIEKEGGIEHGLRDTWKATSEKEGYIEHGLIEKEGGIEHGLGDTWKATSEKEGEIEHGLREKGEGEKGEEVEQGLGEKGGVIVSRTRGKGEGARSNDFSRSSPQGTTEVVTTSLSSPCHLREMMTNARGNEGGIEHGVVEMLARAIRVKVDVVERDPFERLGERAKLNLGHTFGHAYELMSRFELAHGEAVSVGMVTAARLSEVLGLAEVGLAAQIEGILAGVGLPTRWEGAANGEAVWQTMQSDKKRAAKGLRFILPRALGDVIVTKPGEIDKGVVLKVIEEQNGG